MNVNDEGQDKHDRYNSRINESTTKKKDKTNMTGTIAESMKARQ
jgi:hypothetical protein